MSKLYSEILTIDRLTPEDHHRMYSLMTMYYDSMTRDQFISDLYKKTAVILLKDAKSKTIQGFSTLLNIRFKVGGKTIRGAYSGDTIIKKEYWGQKVLGKAFLKYLWLETIKNPFQPFYWFLISKGYKTYLLMANNFTDYYPRLERATPQFEQNIINHFYSNNFSDYFNEKTGLIQFNQVPCKLKDGVAEITAEMISRYPRINYFSKRNPNWKSGTELACIARMTMGMPIKYAIKTKLKKVWDLFTSPIGQQKGKTA